MLEMFMSISLAAWRPRAASALVLSRLLSYS
jgi:hypothetical protein